MQTKIIPQADALALSQRAEDHFFDRKAAAIKGAKLQKAAVAFANADGGEVYVGIADDKAEADPAKRWTGATSIEEYNQHIQALMEVQPALPMEFTFLRVEGKGPFVLRVDVEKSQSVHMTADGTVYERKGAQSLPVTDPERIAALSFAKGATSFEDYPVETSYAEDIVDSPVIADFLAGYSPSTDPLELSINKGLIDRKNFKPKVAGLLLFARDPAGAVPRKCAVRIARYETKEEDPEREHLGFLETIDGPLYQLIHRTVARVTEIMSAIKVWTTDGPKQMEYPPETLWEIVVNAIIHRDYSVSDDVQVLIFDNRIEVVSPGRLPAFVTMQNILDVRYARNPKIVSLLSRYKNPPNKDIGEGLNTAFQRMKDWKLRSPEIYDEGNYVRVVIPHTPLASPQESIMEFLAKHKIITNRQARDITGIKSENAVKSEFYKLRDAGLIEMIPELKGNKAAWRILEKPATGA
ncbi:ATP-binding protein [Pseudaquabacterium rugosum]|uniref:ATP-binding protein n=1 Tax=Pseudaquabacterium rugosum TaxID=2984194 RepID=A0ABU9BJE2_9BURK